jgi:hypothetical protein
MVDAAATGTIISSSHYHLNTGSFLGLNRDSQLVAGSATFRNRATPGVGCNIGRFRRVAFVGCAVEWVRREEKFHALDVPCRCASALVHITTTDPFCAGRHPYLVSTAVIANCRAGGMAAVEVIIARLL